MKWFTRVEETRVLQEAIDWAMACAPVHTMAEAIEWAIAEYRWNLADEDAVDRGQIKRKIDVLVVVLDRMTK